MKILIAADGSDHTKRMLAYLAAHDWLVTSNEFTVLTVVLEVPKRAASYVAAESVQEYYQEEADHVLKPVREFLDQKGVQAQYLHKVGHPAEQIARQADEGGYDLLALGSHGHGALGNLILGSVATKVLSLCKAPVLLLR